MTEPQTLPGDGPRTSDRAGALPALPARLRTTTRETTASSAPRTHTGAPALPWRQQVSEHGSTPAPIQSPLKTRNGHVARVTKGQRYRRERGSLTERAPQPALAPLDTASPPTTIFLEGEQTLASPPSVTARTHLELQPVNHRRIVLHRNHTTHPDTRRLSGPRRCPSLPGVRWRMRAPLRPVRRRRRGGQRSRRRRSAEVRGGLRLGCVCMYVPLYICVCKYVCVCVCMRVCACAALVPAEGRPRRGGGGWLPVRRRGDSAAPPQGQGRHGLRLAEAERRPRSPPARGCRRGGRGWGTLPWRQGRALEPGPGLRSGRWLGPRWGRKQLRTLRGRPRAQQPALVTAVNSPFPFLKRGPS